MLKVERTCGDPLTKYDIHKWVHDFREEQLYANNFVFLFALSGCSPNPCHNGGTCIEFADNSTGALCLCDVGFAGELCEYRESDLFRVHA